MKKKIEGPIYIGIDLGTDSCGWAVTDDKFKLIKIGKKHLWGIRLFDEAQTAKDRRSHRTQRKRIMRTRYRIGLLQEIFKPLIEKIDPDFFTRLNYSSIFNWDDPDSPNRKPIKHFSLFNDPKYNDKDYFNDYPTIYHLRQELIEKNMGDIDPRLVYLAFHNIIKYRGNFLDPNESSSNTNLTSQEISDVFNAINGDFSTMNQQAEEDKDEDEDNFEDVEEAPQFRFSTNQAEETKDIFNDSKDLGINEIKEKLEAILNPNKDKRLSQVLVLIAGGSAKGNVLFGDETFKEDKIFKSFSFEKYDDNIEPNLGDLNESQRDLIIRCKSLYDARELIQIIGTNDYLSDAMVNRFEMHADQLKRFKAFVKKFYREKRSIIFRAPQNDGKDANYSHYVGSYQIKRKKITLGRSRPDDFYAFIKKELNLDDEIKALENKNSLSADEEEKLQGLQEIRKLISSENFLARSHSGKNGVIKHQLHYKELKAIIDNLCANSPKYKSFFTQSDGEYTNREKIESIFKFKIPYYVGPLDNNPNNKNHWAVKRSNEKITPWNWEKIIDKKESAKAFIERMVNECSYLPNAKALPRNSLLYEKYTTLNELSKVGIKLNDSNNEQACYLSQDLKDFALSLYEKEGTLTIKKLEEALKEKTGFTNLTLVRPNGNRIDKNDFEFSANMRAYADFNKILGRPINASDEAMIEEIILDLTLFEDKEMLRTQIQEANKKYGSPLNQKQLDQISSLKYQGWGKLSKALLEDIKGNYQGSKVSIIQMLEKVVKKDGKDYSYNLMELLNDEGLGFPQAIQEEKVKAVGDDYKGFRDYVENSYNSPMIKRAIIQAMAVIKEIEHIIGRPADRYFLESTRSPDASKKGQNGNKWARINQLTSAYERLQKDLKNHPWEGAFHSANSELQNLKKKNDWMALRSKKLYLYFLQMGKDVYTGKPIPFDAIYSNSSDYDIDHIIPQSKVKDDSLNNLVLVSSTVNQQVKQDIYPLPKEILDQGKTVIEFLRKEGLMSAVKYHRLTRRTDLSDSELEDFINRQLTSTSQSVKGLRDALMVDFTEELKKSHPDWSPETIEAKLPKILYPKANNTSDFRHEFDIFKCREVNDFHHAHDAYLNIVVGDCYAEKFGYHASIKRRDELHKDHLTTNFGKIFDDWIYSLSNSKVYVWVPAGEKNPDPDHLTPTIKMVKSQLKYTDILFTRRLKEQEGGLFDQTIYSPKDTDVSKTLAYASLKGKTNKNSRLALLSDIGKYGYYNKKSIGHLSLIKTRSNKGKSKGKAQYQLIAIPKMANTPKLVNEYISSLGLDHPEVVINKLLLNIVCETFDPLSKEKRTRFSITGKTNNSYWISPMSQPHTPSNITYFCKLIAKYNKDKALTSKDGKNPSYQIENNVVLFRSKNDKENKDTQKQRLDINNPSYNQVQEINQSVIKAVYDYIIEQMGKPIYSQDPIFSQYEKIRKRLIDAESEFLTTKSIEDQISLLSNCLTELQCRSCQGNDLSFVNLPKHVGALRINQVLTKSFRIISQSVTGFHEKVIFELDENGNRVPLDEKGNPIK